MYGGRITSDEKSTLSMYVGLIVVTVLAAGGIYLYFRTQEAKELIGFDPTLPIQSDSVLRRRLKPEQYNVVRKNGTEMPYQNKFWNNDRAGIYVDVITNEPLFTSLDKYDAGLGMPTFSKPISKDLLVESLDTSRGIERTEVRVKRSNAHLGYVFPDPESPSGVRYVLNSAAFHFIPAERMKEEHYEAYLPLLEKK